MYNPIYNNVLGGEDIVFGVEASPPLPPVDKTLHLNPKIDKTKYIFDQSIWECNGHFDHCFSNTKVSLCSIWNFHKDGLYPSSSILFIQYFHVCTCMFAVQGFKF